MNDLNIAAISSNSRLSWVVDWLLKVSLKLATDLKLHVLVDCFTMLKLDFVELLLKLRVYCD